MFRALVSPECHKLLPTCSQPWYIAVQTWLLLCFRINSDVMSLLQAQGLSRNKGIFMSGDTETKEAGIMLFYLCIYSVTHIWVKTLQRC